MPITLFLSMLSGEKFENHLLPIYSPGHWLNWFYVGFCYGEKIQNLRFEWKRQGSSLPLPISSYRGSNLLSWDIYHGENSKL